MYSQVYEWIIGCLDDHLNKRSQQNQIDVLLVKLSLSDLSNNSPLMSIFNWSLMISVRIAC